MVSACYTQVCFNCDQIDHLASACPTAVVCNICKSEGHKAKDCPLPWSRKVSSDNEDENDTGLENNTGRDGGEEPTPANENSAGAGEVTLR